MKILIIDRDDMFSNLVASRARTAGHEVFETRVKNDGIEQIESQRIDAVYVDPAPLADARPVLFQIRRQVHSNPYLVLTGRDGSQESAVRAGCHDWLAKPLDPEALDTSLGNAVRMTTLMRKLGDTSLDFPSSGGVISKSAFNQLFLSALDRVSRYGENARAMFFTIENYADIKMDDGRYAADYSVSRLAQCLVRLRRQSDILAQTNVNQFALLLQRPQAPTESFDAARRFSASLDEERNISAGATPVRITVSLVRLPTGSDEFTRETVLGPMSAVHSG